jgi:hypothetical protein
MKAPNAPDSPAFHQMPARIEYNFDPALRDMNEYLAWALLLLGNTILVGGLGLICQVRDFHFLWAAFCSSLLVTSLTAAPFIRFILVGWYSRYDEFLNLLNGKLMLDYLRDFWAVCAAKYHLDKLPAGEISEPQQKAVSMTAENLFNYLYSEQYGQAAFITPIIIVLLIVAVETIGIVFVVIGHPAIIGESGVAEAISAIAGTYLFAVGDSIMAVRRRTLNISDVYWYAVRLLLATPIGFSMANLPASFAMITAFGVGTLPIEVFLNLLRRVVSAQFNLSEEAQTTDQLIQLEGVTGSISAQFGRDGVGSVDQLIDVDPVSLAIRTGLPLKLILRLASQAVVRRHLGSCAGALVGLGLADVEPIAQLMHDLDAADTSCRLFTTANLQAHPILSNAVDNINAAPPATGTVPTKLVCATLQAAFHSILAEKYSGFLLGRTTLRLRGCKVPGCLQHAPKCPSPSAATAQSPIQPGVPLAAATPVV